MDMKNKMKRIINFKYVKKGKDTLQKKAVKYLGAFLLIMIMCTMLSRFADSLTIPVVQTEKPKVKTIVDEVKAEGRIVKNREEKISVIEGLKVEYVNVSIGALVKTGDVLVELNTEDLKKKIDEIEKNISNDEKSLSRANEDYNRAIATKNEEVKKALDEMNKAKKALDDYRNNPKDNNEENKPEEGDKEEPNKDQNQGIEQALVAEYEAKKSIYDAAVANANDTVDLDRAVQDVKDSLKLDEYNAELQKIKPLFDSEGKVTSPKDGIVTSVFAQNGGVTSDAVISIADKDTGYRFVGQIDADKRTLVKHGQSVDFKLNGAELIEKLTIESISENAENPDMINVTVVLPVGVGEINDMGEIIISSQAKKYGTCIPMAALRQGDNNNYYILAVSEKETVLGLEKVARKIEVNVEKKDNEFAAITDGAITRGEEVIVSSNKTVDDGDRVRLETE